MIAYIIRGLMGVFAINDSGELIDKVLFPREIRKIAQKIDEESLTIEEKNLLDLLKKRGFTQFISSKRVEPYKFEENNYGEKIFRENFRSIAKKSISDTELNSFLTEIGIELSKLRIKEVVKKDSIVIQTVNAIDEIDKSINIFIARLREWYGLHFPEMGRNIDKHEKYAKLISEYGLRSNIKEKDLIDLAKTSMGIVLSENDEKILKEYAKQVNDLYNLRNHLEKYLDHVMKEIAPNTRELAGSAIGARLIALAGGLDKLAKKPSSTIQLLGAEKALFRYLRGKGRSPKYGLLFTHQLIQNAPQQKKGKVARILASKLNIAIKIDYYSKEDRSKELKEVLERSIKKIMDD